MSRAAVFNATGTTDVAEVSRREPGDGQIEVRVVSAALNPTDWKHYAAGWGKVGNVVGSDAAGVVTKVGPGVEGFQVGDCVSSFSHGGYAGDPLAGSFQEYAIFDIVTTLKHGKLAEKSSGDRVDSFPNAAAVNLGLCTVSMSFAHQFKLDPTKSYSDEWLLVIAGTSATGILAIQVAKKMYGLKVVTTANPKHEAYLKKLGADVVIDYKDADVVASIKKATGDDVKYALDTVSEKETYNLANEALREGEAHLDNLLFLRSELLDRVRPNVTLTGTLAYLVVGRTQNLGGMELTVPEGLAEDHARFWKRVNELVVDGTIVSAPLTLLPHGLRSVNDGFSQLQAGVHCTKLVFNIGDTN